MQQLLLHRAPFVIPVCEPVISDGAVLVNGQTIRAVGPFAELKKTHPHAAIIDHSDCALTPALVNAHIHLELSHLPIPMEIPEVAGFVEWIPALLERRSRLGDTGTNVDEAARKTLARLHAQGVAVIGDIGNTDTAARLKDSFPGLLIPFLEFLGSSDSMCASVQNQVADLDPSVLCTAHAPYTTNGALITFLKERAARNNHPFPIHTAEPDSEQEMLSHGRGRLCEFLQKLGFVATPFPPPALGLPPGSVTYLDSLGILDERTICVHAVHVSDAEIELLARTKTKVCLCPGSNRYLQTGTAPVPRMLKHGILPGLGTDSAASNPELSIWREMRLTAEDHPGIDPARIFAMATQGGAEALQADRNYGTLAPGKTAEFLAIPLREQVASPDDLYQYLVCQNHQIKPHRVDA